MPVEIITILNPWLLLVAGSIISLLIWIIKRFVDRVRRMEKEQQEFVTEQECREMIDRRLHPMQRQLERVEEKQDKIIDMIIHKND